MRAGIGIIASSRSANTVRTAAFIAATGITDSTIIGALNVMDLALIANSLDTKIQALYPLVGGTSTTCKYNFMNALDTDAAFRLGFAGGNTFASTGWTPNGTNGFANTYFTPSTSMNLSSNHVSFYSRTNSNGLLVDFGCSPPLYLTYSNFGGLFYIFNMGASTTFANADSRGYYVHTLTSGSAGAIYKNGVSKVALGGGGSLPGVPIYLAAYNNGGALEFSNREYSFYTIGTGLTAGENTTLDSIVTTFQTTLGRNV